VMRGDASSSSTTTDARWVAGGNHEILALSPVSPYQNENDESGGPMTPNGYDDISPITRGEWGFLMSGQPKMARVDVCEWDSR